MHVASLSGDLACSGPALRGGTTPLSQVRRLLPVRALTVTDSPFNVYAMQHTRVTGGLMLQMRCVSDHRTHISLIETLQ